MMRQVAIQRLSRLKVFQNEAIGRTLCVTGVLRNLDDYNNLFLELVMESVIGGYIIEDKSAPWEDRFWIDIPSVGVRTFGNDNRARIFFSAEEAELVSNDIHIEYGIDTVVTKRSDLYPPTWWF